MTLKENAEKEADIEGFFSKCEERIEKKKKQRDKLILSLNWMTQMDTSEEAIKVEKSKKSS